MEENQRLLVRIRQLEQDLREEKARQEQQHWNSSSKMELLETEVVRLNKALEGKVNECQSFEDQAKALQRDAEDERQLRRELAVSLGEYENKIVMMGQEIERLNGVLATKVESYQTLEEEYHRYQENALARLNQLNDQARQYQDSQS